MPEAQATRRLGPAAEKGGSQEEVFAALEAAVKADVDAFLRSGRANARHFEGRLSSGPYTVEPSTPPTESSGRLGRSVRSRSRGRSRCAPRTGERRGAGLRGLRGGTPSPSPRPRRAAGGGAVQRGPQRPVGFDPRVRVRPAGAVRRPPPEDLHHAVGPDAAGTGLLSLPRLPPGELSARPGPGPARHLAVSGRHPAGGYGGSRGQLRQGERVVGGPGRGGGRDPADRALRRGARPRNRP